MDLLDFEGQALYFDQPLDQRVQGLIAAASERYASGEAEAPLREAEALAPESLVVLVALYRFYYYQHRLPEAIAIGKRAMAITAKELSLPYDWRELSPDHVASAAVTSMGLLRFHLLCLKACAYLKLRMGSEPEGKEMLRKILDLDTNNRLGARQILDVVDRRLRAVP